jgi:hypothetical protein
MTNNFSPRALGLAHEYLKKNIQIIFEQDGQMLLEPQLTFFGTIWDKSKKIDFIEPSQPKKLIIDREKDVIYRNKFDNFIEMGVMWIQLKSISKEGFNGEVPRNGNIADFKNIPKGTYILDIKAGYEPSNDSYCKFKDLIVLE